MKGHGLLLHILSLGLLLALASGLSASALRAEYAHRPGADLNVGSYGGLAIGVPGEDIGTASEAGGVNVLYGSSGGLSTTGNQWFDQNTPGMIGSAEAGDDFGSALATGDLNGDGYADLAVGVPSEDIGSEAGAGGVHILYGSSGGLSTSDSQWFDQNTPGVIGSAEASDRFGYALAVGDLNGDGYGDLAVGVPGEEVGGEAYAGGVNVLYGSPGGLSTTGNQWFDQNTPGMIGSAEAGDDFGWALAIGDLNGDGYADLAVGVPDQWVGSEGWKAGGVHVLYGSSGGLSTTGNQWFDQDTPGMIGSAEAEDHCGWALAIGDLNGDGYADLAVGVPGEGVGGEAHAGGVNILYGSSGGLSTTGNQWFDQNTPGMSGSAEASDHFGDALAAGDLNGDGYADLAVGVPGEGVGTASEAGGVNVLYGSSGGLSTSDSQWFDQNNPGVIGSAEAHDQFGYAVAVGDLNGDGHADLAVGVPGEGVGGEAHAGGVNILYGSSGGLSTTGNQWFDQDTPGMIGSAEASDHFGWAVAIWSGYRYRIYLPLVVR